MKNLQKDFVTYNQALRLKALGFNYNVLGFYYDKYTLEHCCGNTRVKDLEKDLVATPTFSQAFRFFREKYKLDSSIQREKEKVDGKWIKTKFYMFSIENDEDFPLSLGFKLKDNATYEEAESACLDELIEIIESQQK